MFQSSNANRLGRLVLILASAVDAAAAALALCATAMRSRRSSFRPAKIVVSFSPLTPDVPCDATSRPVPGRDPHAGFVCVGERPVAADTLRLLAGGH